MVARRALAALAALLAAVSIAGCAKTITGRGALAADAVQPGGGPGPSASPSASTSESPSTAPSASSSSSDNGVNQVCQALDKDAAAKAFGAPVTLQDSQQTGCQITADTGDSMIVAVFDYLTLAEYRHGSFTDLAVDGHPALRTDSNIIYVARSHSASDQGLLAAYFSGLGSNGQTIATAMLQQLLKKYSK
jgi:hypothetical protein